MRANGRFDAFGMTGATMTVDSGSVVFPETMHLDQRRAVKLRQQLGFVDKTVQAHLEGVAVPFGEWMGLGAVAARGESGRHVFLERDHALE